MGGTASLRLGYQRRQSFARAAGEGASVIRHETRMYDWLKGRKAPEPHRGMPSPRLDEGEFKRRFRDQFHDSSFDALAFELDRIAHGAWEAYTDSRKPVRDLATRIMTFRSTGSTQPKR
jgi:hypothetical protein